MNVQFTDDIELYAAAVLPFLERDPVRCTVPLTVIANVRSGLLDTFTGSWVEEDSGAVVGTASWTPPFELLLSLMTPNAAEILADAWAEHVQGFGGVLGPGGVRGPGGVLGPREPAEACARRLGQLTRREPRVLIAERLFRLDGVIDPPQPEGGAVPATSNDRELALLWFEAFVVEAGVTRGYDLERDVQARIDEGRLHFWRTENGPVCCVGHTVNVAGVTRIGPVYTAPEQRERGFARALVAAVSRVRLERGDTACCLFTDLANPVSNAIYQQVGYRPVGDYAHVNLVEAG
jgi:GNAT superfamily N-acetyltransferase